MVEEIDGRVERREESKERMVGGMEESLRRVERMIYRVTDVQRGERGNFEITDY